MLIYLPFVGWVPASEISVIISVIALSVSVISFVTSHRIKKEEVKQKLAEKRAELLVKCAETKILCEDRLATMDGLLAVTDEKFYDLPEFHTAKKELELTLAVTKIYIEELKDFTKTTDTVEAVKKNALIQTALIEHQKTIEGFSNLHEKMKIYEKRLEENPDFVPKYWKPKNENLDEQR